MTSFWRRMRRQSAKLVINTPPDELPAAVVGCVVNGRIQARHLTSTLFDLAQRGFLNIVQEQDDLLFQRSAQKDTHLTLAEQLFLRDLFTDYQQQIPFYQLPPRLNKLMHASDRFLRTEKKQAIATMKKDHKKKWQQFANYLRQEDQLEEPERFGQYFSYAVTLGLEVDWALRFTDACKASLPIWYATPQPEQQLGELVHLAQTVTRLLTKRAPEFHIPSQPGAFAHIADGGGIL